MTKQSHRLWLVTCGVCAMALAASGAAPGSPSGDWEEALASRFSGEWRRGRQERAALAAQLRALPVIPTADFGGPAGFMSERRSGPRHPYQDDNWLQIQWRRSALVDMVALVPARNYDEIGIDPNYEVPEDFRVLLLDEQGMPVKVLADERDSRADPVRRGHPFLYRVDPPLRSSGIRIEALRSFVDPKRKGFPVFMSWGEVFCFEGERNVAAGAPVSSSGLKNAFWPWRPEYVVDEMTPLGLPEIPDPKHLAIGWLSPSFGIKEQSLWLEVDLGGSQPLDGLRIFPLQRPLQALMPGIYFPERFVIEVSATGEAGSYRTVFAQDKDDFDNPGDHAVTLRWPGTTGRFVRLRSLTLRKIARLYPAFLGFSELEALHDGVVVSGNRKVTASHNPQQIPAFGGLFWSPESLTDGYTSRGKIISNRRWLEQLHEVHEIETAIHRLDVRSAAITTNFRRGAITAASVAGLLLIGILVALPIRHRRSELLKLRALRAQIAADLHDEIGSSMGSIQLLTEAALRKPELAVDRLRTIRLLSTGSVASLRDIVWLLRPGSGFQNPSLEHFRETAAILLDDLVWDFESDAPSKECRLARATNRQLLLFFREVLHNSVRHSKCRAIRIKTSLADRIFTLQVSDDGCGIPPEKLASPFCLRALKERARNLKATLETTSAPGQGTTHTLRLPLNRSNSAKPS